MDVHAVQHILTGGRLVQHADNVHQGGFARAGLAHNRNELAGIDGQVDAVQDLQLIGLADVVAFADAAHRNERPGRVVSLRPEQALRDRMGELFGVLHH